MTDEKLLENMKILHLDHAPDGWPPVRMSDITRLLDIIDRQAAILNGKTQFDVMAVTAERCAKIAESYPSEIAMAGDHGQCTIPRAIAAAIRQTFGLSD